MPTKIIKAKVNEVQLSPNLPVQSETNPQVTYLRFAVAMGQTSEEIREVKSVFLDVKFEYETLEAAYKTIIWSDKDWLINADFVNQLPSDKVFPLSNETSREAALKLAKRYDSVLADAYKRYLGVKANLEHLESIYQSFQTFEGLYRSGYHEIEMRLFPGDMQYFLDKWLSV